MEIKPLVIRNNLIYVCKLFTMSFYSLNARIVLQTEQLSYHCTRGWRNHAGKKNEGILWGSYLQPYIIMNSHLIWVVSLKLNKLHYWFTHDLCFGIQFENHTASNFTDKLMFCKVLNALAENKDRKFG